MSKTNLPVINCLRGIAAMAVCLEHFVVGTIGFVNKNGIVHHLFSIGIQGVQLFFIISGIVIPLSMIDKNYTIKHWGTFMLKRFIRIEPAFLASVIIATSFMFIRNYMPGSVKVDLVPSLRDILLHIGYMVPFVKGANWVIPVYWTLAIEFQYYLILSFIFPMVISDILLSRIVFYLLLIIPSFLNIAPTFFPHWGPLFLVGNLFALKRMDKINLKEYTIASIFCLIPIYINIGHRDLITTLVTLSIIHFIPNKTTKWLLFLGMLSYSLYLTHGTYSAGILNYLSKKSTTPTIKILFVIGTLTFSIIFAYIFYKLIEEPSHKLSQKIKYKRESNEKAQVKTQAVPN